MQETEELDEVKTPLNTALNRIALGVTFGSLVVAFLFCIWALTHEAGPNIGVAIFILISFGCTAFLGVNVFMKHHDIE